MLTTLITILHVLVCIFLILVILLQPGTDGGMALGGGGGQASSAFGGGGGVSFLQKVTTFCAAIFFLSWFNGPIAPVIFDVVPARISATVAGAYLLFIHLAGDTISFPFIGALSDRFGIDRAVLVLPSVALAGGLVVLMASRSVARDMARVSAP